MQLKKCSSDDITVRGYVMITSVSFNKIHANARRAVLCIMCRTSKQLALQVLFEKEQKEVSYTPEKDTFNHISNA